jgi:hypothetical protein
MIDNNGITYKANHEDPAYCEWIYLNDKCIGEITGSVMGGYELRKFPDLTEMQGVIETIAYFETVCDSKSFVNQAGGL